MSDIAKCSGKGCLNKKNCYRYTAPEEPLQTFFLSPPMKPDGACDYFVANTVTPFKKKPSKKNGSKK